MPRKPVNFRRSDLQRAIRAAREEGLAFDRIEVDPKTGKISVILAPPVEKSSSPPAPQPV